MSSDRTIDTDEVVLQDAATAVSQLDMAYRRAVKLPDVVTGRKLRPKVKAAYEAYSLARLKLMKKGTITSDAHVAEMRRIRAEIDQAADTQALVEGAVKLIGFLGKFLL